MREWLEEQGLHSNHQKEKSVFWQNLRKNLRKRDENWMSEKFFHTELKIQIEKIANDSKKYKKINVERKIPIPHPNQELVFHYKPELNLITKMGKKIIFEILDDQINDYNLILADIIQCYLLDNVTKVFFISKDLEGYNMTRKLSRIVGSILEEKGFFKNEIPEVFVYTISYEEVQSGESQNILLGFAKKDNWG